MHCTCLYADAAGESRFEEKPIEFQEQQYAPPAPNVQVSQFTPAIRWGLLRLPPGWDSGLHPVPTRQIIFVLSGTIEVELSGGETRRFMRGDFALTEDTTGTGHKTRVVGTEGVVLAIVHLAN